MKRLLNYLFIFLVLLLPFNTLAYGSVYEDYLDEYNSTEVITYSSGSYDLIIDDRANLLTEDEEIKLQDEMTKLLEYGNIAFVSNGTDYGSAESKARNYYSDKFGSESGTVFYIDMVTRYIYIYSDGANYDVITDMKANIITDNVYQYATNQEYYECASVAFDQMYILLDGGKFGEPF